MLQYFFLVLLANRVLFAYTTYYKVAEDFSQDSYLRNLCEAADFKKLGRHSFLCSGIELRHKTGVLHYVLQEVVDDTLYNSVNINTLVPIVCLFVLISMLASFHSRYVKNKNQFLPSTQNAQGLAKRTC